MTFVLYHSWVKPKYLSLLSTPVPTQGTQRSFSEADGEALRPSPSADPEIPETRLIALGEAPNLLFDAIREELEKGNYKAVKSGLSKISSLQHGETTTRRFLAGLWNNLGVQEEKYGGIAASVTSFEQAAQLAPDDATIHLNLTQAYWGLRHPALTAQFLQKVIRLAPTDPFPHLALADVLIDEGDSESASRQLREGLLLAKHDPSLTSYARRLATRLEQPQPSSDQLITSPALALPAVRNTEVPDAFVSHTHPGPSQKRSAAPFVERAQAGRNSMAAPASPQSHFTVTFDGKEDSMAWTQIHAILEYAYQDIGDRFGYQPGRPISVVLHTGQAFGRDTGNPGWADTLFDSRTASIHLPLQGALEDLGVVSRVLRHQFVHALVQDKLASYAPNLPVWITEGLALQLAEDPWPDLEGLNRPEARLIPLTTLRTEWHKLSPELRAFAYWEAAKATKTLTDRFSVYKVRQLMNLIREGQSFETAFEQKLSISYDRFERTWEKTVESPGAS